MSADAPIPQSPAAITVYGIPNCSSVKRARSSLEEQSIAYDFVDVSRTPPSLSQIKTWASTLGMEQLINRKSTAWRGLSPQEQASAANENDACALLLQYPKLIKRPLVVWPSTVSTGIEAFEKHLPAHLAG